MTGTRLLLVQKIERVPFCLVIAEWETYGLLKALQWVPELDFHDVLFEVDYKVVADSNSNSNSNHPKRWITS